MFSCKGKTTKVVEEKYPDGSPKTERFYKEEDQKKELVKEIKYYDNHQKQYEGDFKSEKRNGKWTYWREDGKIWSEGTFKDGLRNGPGKVYYEDGKVYYECEYKNDIRCGVWHFYNEEGKEMKVVDYDAAKVNYK